MTVLVYRVATVRGELFRWIASGRTNVVGTGESASWTESHKEMQRFLAERARRLAKQRVFESVQVRMATE